MQFFLYHHDQLEHCEGLQDQDSAIMNVIILIVFELLEFGVFCSGEKDGDLVGVELADHLGLFAPLLGTLFLHLSYFLLSYPIFYYPILFVYYNAKPMILFTVLICCVPYILSFYTDQFINLLLILLGYYLRI